MEGGREGGWERGRDARAEGWVASGHRGSGVEERLRDKRCADEGGADDELVGGGQRSVDPRHEELPPKLSLVHLQGWVPS
jgi:hypothetical protein